MPLCEAALFDPVAIILGIIFLVAPFYLVCKGVHMGLIHPEFIPFQCPLMGEIILDMPHIELLATMDMLICLYKRYLKTIC